MIHCIKLIPLVLPAEIYAIIGDVKKITANIFFCISETRKNLIEVQLARANKIHRFYSTTCLRLFILGILTSKFTIIYITHIVYE